MLAIVARPPLPTPRRDEPSKPSENPVEEEFEIDPDAAVVVAVEAALEGRGLEVPAPKARLDKAFVEATSRYLLVQRAS